jgi:HD-like signal output (HDOD) protein
MEHKALLVGDEPLLRHLFQPLSERLQGKYRIFTANSSEGALRLLKQQRFDVVAADFAVPGADGMQFLSQVVFHQPDCPRIIFASDDDRIKFPHCLFVGHRYFNKPCEVEALSHLMLKLASFREVVCNDKIRRMIGGLGSLPGPPATFLKLEQILESRSTSMQEVGELVEQDPVLTAKLLQIVNSAHVGGRQVFSVTTAVQLLGLSMVRVLALGLHTFTAYNRKAGKSPSPSGVWDHSLRVATNARRIARANQFSAGSCERAFLAGLLHDVGGIVVHASAPRECDEATELVRRCQIPSVIAEAQRFAATYADIGAYLLALWGIDDETTSIVQYQDRLEEFTGTDVSALAAVHVAHAADAGDSVSYPIQFEQLAAMGFPNSAEWLQLEEVSV